MWYGLESLEFCFEIVIRSGKIFHISQSIGKITRDRKKKKRTKTKEKKIYIYIFRTKTIKKLYIYIYNQNNKKREVNTVNTEKEQSCCFKNPC